MQDKSKEFKVSGVEEINMKTNIKEINKRIIQAIAEANIEKTAKDVNLSKSYFKDYFKDNFGYEDVIDINDNIIESIEVSNGITAINFYSDKILEKVKKLCYEYLKEKNTDLEYNDIVKIAISSVKFELNKPIEYFLVAQLKNNETISMDWHLQNYQIDALKNYIPEIFDLIAKDEYEIRLGFEINKAFDIDYDTNLISFVDVNGLNNFIDHKKGDYKKLKELRLYDKTPDHDWYDLDQKKYWWHTCHKKDKTPPKELEENFWAPYFIKIDDYGLYLVWINIEKGKYNLAEINGITNNEIPKSLIKTVSESLEIANEN